MNRIPQTKSLQEVEELLLRMGMSDWKVKTNLSIGPSQCNISRSEKIVEVSDQGVDLESVKWMLMAVAPLGN